MTSFYRNIGTEKSFAEALRAAQLEILGQAKWRDPFYWAAFTLNGDYLGSGKPKPLPANLFQNNAGTAATPPTTQSATAATVTLEVTTDRLNVRSGPGANFAPLGEIHAGDQVQVVGQSGDGMWWQVCCVDGQQGWVVNNENYIHVLGNAASKAFP